MPTTRSQDAAKPASKSQTKPTAPATKPASTTKSKQQTKPTSTSGKPSSHAITKPPSNASHSKADNGLDKVEEDEKPELGTKREVEQVDGGGEEEKEKTKEPPAKKPKVDEEQGKGHPAEHVFQSGTIERGHIYFFYRPRVELEEVHSVDDVQRFHMLLVPRPPQFSTSDTTANGATSVDVGQDDGEMNVIQSGGDAVPAAPTTNQKKKKFRLVSIGKKTLPDPDAQDGGRGGGRKAVFWATVVTVGEDLSKLQDGLGAKEYETKTKGTRHQGPARIAARGAYAIVNSEGRTPSSRETHLGYHLSHPTPENFGEVQEALGIHTASSFVVQVKNPDAPNTGPAQVGLSKNRRANFPNSIMKEVFGAGGERGREEYGLRFASVEKREMLDYEGAELLFIAARSGDAGLEASLGEGRGEALAEVEKDEGKHSIDSVLKELAMDAAKIPAEPLEGDWE